MRKLPKINYWTDPLSCFQECFGEIRQCDLIEGFMDDGRPYRMYARTFLKRIKKRHCWGFYNRRKNQINIWFDKYVNPVELVRLIAHELAHSKQKKHASRSWREQNATEIEMISGDSVGLMMNLFKMKLNKIPSVRLLTDQILLTEKK